MIWLIHVCSPIAVHAVLKNDFTHALSKIGLVQTILQKKVEKVYTIYDHMFLFLFFRQGIYVDHSPGLSRQLEIYSWY